MKKHLITLISLIVAVSFVLSGCVSDGDYTSKSESKETSIDINESSESSVVSQESTNVESSVEESSIEESSIEESSIEESSIEESSIEESSIEESSIEESSIEESSVEESSIEESSIEESSIEEPSIEEPSIEDPSIPDEPDNYKEIYNLAELRDYLNEMKNKDILTFDFTYLGDEEFDAELVARMCNSFYVTYNWIGNDYTIELMEFPGDRIVDAFFSGDDSALTDDEKLALERALELVAAADQESENDYELELYLHNYLASTITYYSPFVNVPDPNDPPRHLTAIGGLLAGSANCQGYSDSFYVLASIAGFKVGRMSAVDDSGEGHMLNTIFLDGKWYVVDVTFDDVLFGDEDETTHRLFNAGRDMCDEYSWIPEYEYNQIAENSDELYYYNCEGQTYKSLDEIVDAVTEQWLMGTSELHIMLEGQVSNGDELSGLLYDSLMETGEYFDYNIFAYTTGENTYFIIRFYC